MGTRWSRVSRKAEAFFRAGEPRRAWELIEAALRGGFSSCEADASRLNPDDSSANSFFFLHRATMLATQFGDHRLASSWIEIHRSQLGRPPDERTATAYAIVRLAIELASKNYTAVDGILRDLDWNEAPPAAWAFNVRLLIAVRANYHHEILDLLRRPSPILPFVPTFTDAFDRGNRLRILGNYYLVLGDWKRCSACLRAALKAYAKASGIDARLKELEIRGTWGMAAFREGSLEEAEQELERAVEAAALYKHPFYQDRFRLDLAEIHRDREQFLPAEELFLEVERDARQRGNEIDAYHFTRIRAMLWAADLAVDAADGAKAVRYLHEASRLLRERSHRRLEGYLHLIRGRVTCFRKAGPCPEKALGEFHRAEEVFRSIGDGDRLGLLMVHLYRAQLYLRLKQIKESLGEAIQCMEIAKASRHKPYQARCLLLKSKLLLEDDVSDPEGLYEELLSSIGSVRSPVMLFKIVANLYLHSWDLGDQLDLTDYHLRQIHKMAGILDQETFKRLYEKHVARRVVQRALVRTFGVDPSAFGKEELD